MKNKVAIVFCVHHKPWLIMSTLVTVMAQDFQDFDLFFAYQKGDGTNTTSRAFGDYFEEYYDLQKRFGVNPQLDTYDPRTIDVCRINREPVYHLDFTNNHALDSGAWYKFIRTGLWQDYEYVMFLGEGALFTGGTVLSETLNFARANRVHFITGSQEKRRIARDRFLGGFASSAAPTEMTAFHDRMIAETFRIFSRDPEFKRTVEQWPAGFPTVQEHHVPDIWGPAGMWMRAINAFYPKRPSNNGPALPSGKRSPGQAIFSIYNRSASECLIRMGNKPRPYSPEVIYVDGRRRRLNNVVDVQGDGRVKFHRENSPEWFGATCNHFMSREFLKNLSRKLEQYEIYDCLQLPYAATALENIWGLIPCWLGFDKWFFNGIHRVRKNFINYRREDDADGLTRYLNRYYRGRLAVRDHGPFIKITRLAPDLCRMRGVFNEMYF